jgi:hypothetical protein
VVNSVCIKGKSGEDIAGIDWYEDLDGVSLTCRTSESGVLRIIRGHFRIRSCYMLTEPRLAGRIEPQ